MPESKTRALLCLSSMPQTQMSHPLSPLSCSGTSLQIKDLRQCMDDVDDGFSHSESEDSVVDEREKRGQSQKKGKSFSGRWSHRSDHSHDKGNSSHRKSSSDLKLSSVSRQESKDESIIPTSPLLTSSNSSSKAEDPLSKKSRFAHALAFKFLDVRERTCEFGNVKTEDVVKGLSFEKEKLSKPQTSCICSSLSPGDDILSGWGVVSKPSKYRSAKRSRKSITKGSSEVAFNRLIGMSDKDDFEFQHHPDTHRYIEQYRFQHTIGDVCRRAFDVKPTIVRRNVESDPYYRKIRNTICAIASNCDILAILSGEKDNQSTSSSDNSVNNRSKSDEENDDPRSLGSMKDRGKTLNLAPVRECTVPDLAQTDNQEQLKQHYLTLNQYLNLVIPPKSGLGNNPLQVAIDEAKEKRYRVANTGDNHLFPACTPRRGARPLRLGSAEFVKPGTPEQFGPPEARWSGTADKKTPNNVEKRVQRSSTFHASTVPGNLYVGSTVSRDSYTAVGTNASRTTSGAHRKKPQTPQTPPNHTISGKKCKPYERTGDSGSSRERNWRSSARDDWSAPSSAPLPSRTPVTTEVRENNHNKKQEKILSVNVAHLGIRGRTFKPDEHLTIVYKFNKEKNRRIAVNSSVKS